MADLIRFSNITYGMEKRKGAIAEKIEEKKYSDTAGVRSPEYICELSRPQKHFRNLQSSVSVYRWRISPPPHSTPLQTHTASCLDCVNQVYNCPEEVESDSTPRCGGVRLHVGNGGVPTTAGDSDDKAKQTYSRGTAAKHNIVMERSWVFTCKYTLPSLPFHRPVSSSHIEARFVWADWKVLSC